MALAGVLSGLLGIGSGALKVIAMDRIMRMPFKVSTTTSNFMIGVTAAASAGRVPEPRVHRPGPGAARHARRARRVPLGRPVSGRRETRTLRIVFAVAIVGLGIEMMIKGVTGRL